LKALNVECDSGNESDFEDEEDEVEEEKEVKKENTFVPIKWENAVQKLNLNDENLEHLQRDKRIENAWNATTNKETKTEEREPTPDMKDDRNLAPSLIMWNIPHREFDLDARMEKMKEQDKQKNLRRERSEEALMKECLRNIQSSMRRNVWTFLESKNITNCRRVHVLIHRNYRKKGTIFCTSGKAFLTFKETKEHHFVSNNSRNVSLPSGPGDFSNFDLREKLKLDRLTGGWNEAEYLTGLHDGLMWESHKVTFTWNERQ